MGSLTDAAKKASAKTDASLAKVNREMERFLESVKIDAGVALRKVAGEITAEAAAGTPVDTGQARAGWTVGLKRLGHKESIPATSPTTGKPTSRVAIERGRVQGRYGESNLPNSMSVTVSNGVRHAVFLEAGHSSQNRGFVRRAMIRGRRRLRDVIRQIRPKGVK